MVVRIAGKRMYLWRAVDHEARSSTCLSSAGATAGGAAADAQAAKKHGFAPKLLVTDKLRSYAAAFRRSD